MLDLSSKKGLDKRFTAGAAVLLKSQHIAGMLENTAEKMMKHSASVFHFVAITFKYFLLIKKMHL